MNEPVEIDYPSSDGEPVAESSFQIIPLFYNPTRDYLDPPLQGLELIEEGTSDGRRRSWRTERCGW